mmetsp:Transcript_34568/g.99219  ORF Transcript_34568/g.99219 Transcript_34568/m.99219 type:complete len:540 (-) Transcript_34568:44-1663(-)
MAEGRVLEKADRTGDGGGGGESRGERLAELEAALRSLRGEFGENCRRREMQAASMLEEQLTQSDTLQLLMRANEQRDREAVGLSVRLEAVEQCLMAAMQAEPATPGVGALAARLGAAEELTDLRERLRRLELAQGAADGRTGSGAGSLEDRRQLEADRNVPCATSPSSSNNGFASPDSCEKVSTACGRLHAGMADTIGDDMSFTPSTKEASPWNSSLADHSCRSPEGLGSGPTEEQLGGFGEANAGRRSSDSPDLSEVSGWLARLVGQMEAGLRVEFSSRLHKLGGELRDQLRTEAATQASAAEARADAARAEFRAEVQRAAEELTARIQEPKAVSKLTAATAPEANNTSPVSMADCSSRHLSIPAYLPPRRMPSPGDADCSATTSARGGATSSLSRSPAVPRQLAAAGRTCTTEELAVRPASHVGAPPPSASSPSRGGPHVSSRRSLPPMSPNLAPNSPLGEQQRFGRGAARSPSRRGGEAAGTPEAALVALRLQMRPCERMQSVEKTAFSMQLPVQAQRAPLVRSGLGQSWACHPVC